MNTNLRTAPHYFVIDSIGGMHEGYSDTTCRRVEDVAAPELAKAMVEEFIDQWIHTTHEYYSGLCDELGVDIKHVNVIHEECKHGGWHRVYFAPDHFSPELAEQVDFESAHTLFIQVYDGVMLGDGVVVYDQMDDMVLTITHKSTAIRMAEEGISIEVERIKARLLDDKSKLLDRDYYVTSLIYCYDCLADVVRDLEWPQDTMVDIDDSCTHYFPVQKVKRLMYDYTNKITTDSFSLA
jgi:hypothetical protein